MLKVDRILNPRRLAHFNAETLSSDMPPDQQQGRSCRGDARHLHELSERGVKGSGLL